MEVCIIGGGHSGIASAKLCKDYGLIPVILDKQSSPGGLWLGSQNEVGVWNSLETTGCKFCAGFSDLN